MKKYLLTTLLLLFVLFSAQAQNYAVSLDGESGYGEAPFHDAYNFGEGDFTIEAIIYIDRIRWNQAGWILSRVDSDNGNYCVFIVNRGLAGGFLSFNTNSSGEETVCVTAGEAPVQQWVHITGVRDGEENIFYINGNEVDRSAHTGNCDSDGNLMFGAKRTVANLLDRYFQGNIDEVRIWNAARSAEEIEMNLFVELNGDEENLVGYWNFNDAFGENFADFSTINNPGVLEGGHEWIEPDWFGSEIDIIVNIEPWDDPLIVGPEGRWFRYHGWIENISVYSSYIDVWTEVLLPDGTTYGPLFFAQNVFINLEETLYSPPSQNVPGYAPPGDYVYIAKAGQYPTAYSEDNFEFSKLEGFNLSADCGHWAVSNWFDENVQSNNAEDIGNLLPMDFLLTSPYPNPFNPSTTMVVFLPEASMLQIMVYNTIGQQVEVLTNNSFDAGYHNLTFDASSLSSGIYFIQAMVPGKMNEIRKIVLMK